MGNSSSFGLVLGCGSGVDADGVESGAAEQLGDADETRSGPGHFEVGGEGVSQYVGGFLVVQPGTVGDLVEDAAGSAGGEAAAAIVD